MPHILACTLLLLCTCLLTACGDDTDNDSGNSNVASESGDNTTADTSSSAESADNTTTNNSTATDTTGNTADNDNTSSTTPNLTFNVSQQYLQISASIAQSDSSELYVWDFGDGHQDSGASVSHRYNVAGSYTVTVTEQHSNTVNSTMVTVTTASTLKLLPLGDSITQGTRYSQSYRYSLWKQLLDVDAKVDFVGSLQSNHQGSPDFPNYLGQSFDSDHEGHYGWSSSQICNTSNCALSGWLNGYSADIALMHLGTNDMLWGATGQASDIQTAFANLTLTIAALRQNNPAVKIALAKLIPIRGIRPARDSYIVDFNSQVDAFANNLSSTQSPIITVDHYSGFSSDLSDDGVHPNTQGEAVMAQRWYNAIQPWLN